MAFRITERDNETICITYVTVNISSLAISPDDYCLDALIHQVAHW